MTPDDPKLDPRFCNAIKRDGSGERCRQPAGHGVPGITTGRCSRHGGSTPTHRRAAERAMALRACEEFGVPVPIDPATALIDELARSYGLVLFYESLIAELQTHPGLERDATGLYGRLYHASGAATGEAKPHVLVSLYNAERKHYKDVAAAALSAGVAQRVIELAEDTARQVVGVLSDFALRLGLDPSSPEVREAGRAALTVVARGPNE